MKRKKINLFLKKIFKDTLLVSLCVILLIIFYFTYIFLSIPFEKFDQKFQDEAQGVEINKIPFEEGGSVNISNWKNFHTFSKDERPFYEFKESLLQSGMITQEDGRATFHAFLEMFDLYQNECKEIYCFQIRIPFDHIDAIFWKGLIGIEDTRFLDHHGVDFRSLARAFWVDLKEMSFVQGGSTITQQLAKNLFFSTEKTFNRKIKELISSIYIEWRFSKEKILEAYFNEFDWGYLQGLRVKGLFAASLFYFEKRPENLDPFEATILVSLLKGPNFFHPIKNLERLKERTQFVYKKLQANNLISSEDKSFWNDKKWANFQKRLIELNEDKPFAAIWDALNEKSLYLNNFEKFIFILKVKKVEDRIETRIGKKDISVKAIIGKPGGTEFFEYYSKFERDKEKGLTQERHQIGSTIKPIVFQSFFKNGKTPEDLVSTAPILLKLKSGDWTPGEAHFFEEPETDLKTALQRSLNNPIIITAKEIGFDLVEKDLIEYFPNIKRPLGEFPSQLLGSLELSLKELFDGYAQFIKKECLDENQDDNILTIMADPTQTTIREVVDEQFAKLEFFGKTGTSNNGLDNWYVFFDGKSLGVIWVGLEGSRINEDLPLYGGSTAYRIYQDFYRDIGKRFNQLNCDLFPK